MDTARLYSLRNRFGTNFRTVSGEGHVTKTFKRCAIAGMIQRKIRLILVFVNPNLYAKSTLVQPISIFTSATRIWSDKVIELKMNDEIKVDYHNNEQESNKMYLTQSASNKFSRIDLVSTTLLR